MWLANESPGAIIAALSATPGPSISQCQLYTRRTALNLPDRDLARHVAGNRMQAIRAEAPRVWTDARRAALAQAVADGLTDAQALPLLSALPGPAIKNVAAVRAYRHKTRLASPAAAPPPAEPEAAPEPAAAPTPPPPRATRSAPPPPAPETPEDTARAWLRKGIPPERVAAHLPITAQQLAEIITAEAAIADAAREARQDRARAMLAKGTDISIIALQCRLQQAEVIRLRAELREAARTPQQDTAA
jgi:hypothetical protein